MKQYKFEVAIYEGNDEFWEEINGDPWRLTRYLYALFADAGFIIVHDVEIKLVATEERQ